MTRGERWKRFIVNRGWLNGDIVEGKENQILKISICCGSSPTDGRLATFERAMVLEDEDILCYESGTGEVFFQWEDIVQIKIEEPRKKRGWL